MNSEGKGKKSPEVAVKLQVTFEGGEQIPIVYASNVFVRHTEDVFLLTFAQAHGPYIVNPTNEQLRQMKTIPAQVVARIAVPPSQMKTWLDVLNSNYAQFKQIKKGKE